MENKFKKYAAALGAAFMIIILTMIVRPFIRYSILRQNRLSETTDEKTGRGDIYDLNGNLIATDTTLYDVHLDCCMIQNQEEWSIKSRELAQRLAMILPHRTAPQWCEYLQTGRRNWKRFLPIVKNVDHNMADTLSKLPLLKEGRMSGCICAPKQVRYYPYSDLARRTIGVCNRHNGKSTFGIEHSYDSDLKTYDIRTTLLMDHQMAADSILKSVVSNDEDIAGGCMALMEVKTGALLAIANCHRFDDGRIGEYFNYFLEYSYEPGPVAQTMTLTAALSDGIIRRIDHETYTSVAATSDIAMKYTDSQEYFIKWFDHFCGNNKYFNLTEMRDLYLPSQNCIDKSTFQSICAGYSYKVCPLHIMTFYNIIANGGKRIRPTLITKMTSETEGTRWLYPKQPDENIVSEEVADTITGILSEYAKSKMHECFSDIFAGRFGTSRQVIPVELRGVSTDPYHDSEGRCQYTSTLSGFYPADEPEYTVICVLVSKPTHRSHLEFISPAVAVKGIIKALKHT